MCVQCVQMKSFNKLQQQRWQLVAAAAAPSIQPHVILSSGEHIASFFRFLLPVSMHLNASQHCHFQIVVIQYDSVYIQFDFFLSRLQFFWAFSCICATVILMNPGWQLSRWSNMPQRKQRPNRLDMVCFVLSRLTQDTIEDNFPLVRAQIRSYESPAWRQWSL